MLPLTPIGPAVSRVMSHREAAEPPKDWSGALRPGHRRLLYGQIFLGVKRTFTRPPHTMPSSAAA